MQQLSIFDIKPDSTPTQLRYPDPTKARKLRDLADNLQPQIDAKLNPAIAHQRPTRRRAAIVASMRQDAEQLQQIQSWFREMANLVEQGTLPHLLEKIASKSQLEVLYCLNSGNWSDSSIDRILSDKSSDWYAKLGRANLTTVEKIRQAIAILKSFDSKPTEPPTIVKIRNLERQLIGRNIPGYFPTPRSVCERMVQLADLRDGQRVLEPSAGKGSIAEVIRGAAEVGLDVCELQSDLREILVLKGFSVIARDCFEVTDRVYDRILMNPPFGKGAELAHITHAYTLLAEDGRLVAIVPESVSFRQDRQYQDFRDWLADKIILDEPLPEGAFLNSDRPTAVRTRLIVLEK
ncbi:MAG: hypothetical protein N5P05_004104 (plasmid) [Chroococcopsis gigantea SAG 12.99]|jgi:hypothetical protein|nr:hypothetical protein [Chroococcopsis gigantea SAG 12.99]